MQTEAPQATPEASPYAAHIPSLDGIRGLAVLAVMSSHLFPGTARSPLTRAIQSLFAYGATGVDLFFVLSGFLITGILVDSLQDRHFFRKFYARRVLRIFPLYYAVLAGYAVASVVFGMHYSGQLWSMALYLQNTHLVSSAIYDYPGPSDLPLAHFWTLAVEEQFYLVWPLLVFLLRRRRPLLWFCLAATLLCPLLRAYLWLHGWTYFPVHTSTLLRADALLAGAALALLLRSPAHDRVLQLVPWVLGAGVLCTLAILATPASFLATHAGWMAFNESFGYSAFDVVYAAAIGLALVPNLWARLCTLGPLRALGKYSYGLYVLHLPLFFYLQEPLRAFLARHVTQSKAAGVALAGLICFVVSVVAAYLSFHLYEKHFLRLKRYFSYRKPEPAS